jgi:release factor glutamine methyltransferase
MFSSMSFLFAMRLTAWQPAVSMKNPDLGTWLKIATARLSSKSEFPSIEAAVISSFVLQKTREWVIAHPETALNEEQLTALDDAIDRLLNEEPLAYIIGRRSFYGLDLLVDHRVLVPRPETELLVDLAIDWLKTNPDKTRVVDVGTGSGAIAISLACELPGLKITAIDASHDALAVAHANAALHKVEQRIQFIQNDLLEGIDEQFDLVLANLPYIPTQDVDHAPGLTHEPRLALDGGSDGLRLINKLILSCANSLAQNGCVILELQYNQWEVVQKFALELYPQAIISIHQDLAAHPRVVRIQT